MKKSKFSESQIINILRAAESGQKVAELCREHGISQATFYKGQKKDEKKGTLFTNYTITAQNLTKVRLRI